MNRILLCLALLVPALPASAESVLARVESHEYRVSESTRSIVFGRACQMKIDGDSSRFIRKTAFENVLSYQENIRRRDAKILSTIIANNAIKECSLSAK